MCVCGRVCVCVCVCECVCRCTCVNCFMVPTVNCVNTDVRMYYKPILFPVCKIWNVITIAATVIVWLCVQ